MLWKRIPTSVKASDAELAKVWEVVQFLIQRKFGQAFETASRFGSWSSQDLELCIKRLVEKSKQRMFDLIKTAYSSINVQEVANCLNLSNEETFRLGLVQGCSIDETNSFLIPKKKGIFKLYLGILINLLILMYF